MNFTQQDIINGLVQFKSTSTLKPSYLLSAVYGALITPPTIAEITFSRIYQMPTIGNNQLFIDQGKINVLTSTNLSATVPIGGIDPALLFTVNNIGNGFFQLSTKPNVFISPDLYRSLHQSLALYQRSQTCCMVSNHVSRAVWYPHVSSSGVLDSATLYPHALALPLF